MKKSMGTAVGYVPRAIAPTFASVEGTVAPASRPRTRDLRSPLTEPDSSSEALTV